jgi:CrcB protein
MGWTSLLGVGAGAVLGAWLRFWFAVKLNPVFPTIPLGTLVSNLVGGYVVGVAMGAIATSAGLSPQVRLFLITGFCGGLTTFSTFSAETVDLFARGQIGWAFGEIIVHVTGSLAATALGILSIRLLFEVKP